MKNLLWLTSAFVLSSCSTTIPTKGSEEVRIINPYNEAPFKERCEDLGEVKASGRGIGAREEAIVIARNGVLAKSGNLIIVGKDVFHGLPNYVTFTGRGLKCPLDLVPESKDKYQKMIDDEQKKWERLAPISSPAE